MSLAGLPVIPSCAECGLESGGRCRVCRRHLCVDHFAYEDHQPCRERMAANARRYVCYVCGSPARPRQWSTALFAHYVDSGRCDGCRRYICDERHTRLREERVEITADSLRSHRYYVTRRYCDVCAPLRRFGGLRGAARLGSVLALAGTIAGIVLLHSH
jgi:hypothetical protein